MLGTYWEFDQNIMETHWKYVGDLGNVFGTHSEID